MEASPVPAGVGLDGARLSPRPDQPAAEFPARSRWALVGICIRRCSMPTPRTCSSGGLDVASSSGQARATSDGARGARCTSSTTVHQLVWPRRTALDPHHRRSAARRRGGGAEEARRQDDGDLKQHKGRVSRSASSAPTRRLTSIARRASRAQLRRLQHGVLHRHPVDAAAFEAGAIASPAMSRLTTAMNRQARAAWCSPPTSTCGPSAPGCVTTPRRLPRQYPDRSSSI